MIPDLETFYQGFAGFWVRRMLCLFLMVTRWRENLSSGENRAVGYDVNVLELRKYGGVG